MPNSTIYEKFGYDLPKDFGEVAEMCNTTFVCGLDKKWHIKDSYKGDTGKECTNQNTLKQICETYNSGKSSCVKEGNLTYCYEDVKQIPNSINSTGKITSVPEPGSGSFICGFDNTEKTHVTVLAPNCDMCPYNLSAYDGQKCVLKEKPKEDEVEKPKEDVVEKPKEDVVGKPKEESKDKNFSCRFSSTSYTKIQEVHSSCSRDNDCKVSDRVILDKWVDSINVQMDTEKFTISDVINKQVMEGSDIRNTCILGEGNCDETFSSMEELKQYLKDKIVPKRFVKRMKKDYRYGAHIVDALSVKNNACDASGKCSNSKVLLKDYVHISPHTTNKIEIKKLNNENVSSLFINDKKVGGGVDLKNSYYSNERKGLDNNHSVVHCSEEGTCKKYTENIDTIIDLNNSDSLFKPKGSETVYKIKKGNDVFILDNEYTVTTSTDGTKECSKLLCTINSEGCPSDYCKRGLFNECVPSDTPVLAKELK
tara:strand:- start:1304 stop:2743 length:1440 start_codon:yes stop_codon:yes gene_type:complete